MFFSENYSPEFICGKKNRVLTLTGVPGCGKNFLVEKAKSFLPEIGNQITVFEFGTHLYNTVKKMMPCIQLSSRDGLGNLPDDVIKGAIEATLDTMLANQPVLNISHVVYQRGDSLIINPNNERAINPSGYVFVWANPALIHDWRLEDQSRRRNPQTVWQIALHQKIAKRTTEAFALSMRSEFTLVNNGPRRWNKAADTLAQMSRELLL